MRQAKRKRPHPGGNLELTHLASALTSTILRYVQLDALLNLAASRSTYSLNEILLVSSDLKMEYIGDTKFTYSQLSLMDRCARTHLLSPW